MSSTRGWPLVARGAYRELLDAQWDMGTLPIDQEELRALAGATEAEWAIAWPRIESKFPLNCQGRKNARLESHRDKAVQLYEKRALGARTANALRDAERSGVRTHQSQSQSQSQEPSQNKTSKSTEARAKRSQPARKRCPEDFFITQGMRSWAAVKAVGVDIDQETESFKDYEFRNGHTDWVATWRTWMRKAKPKPMNTAVSRLTWRPTEDDDNVPI